MPSVDVIVAVRNEEQNLPIFVEKLFALAFPPDVDVKVVFIEDSSTDGTRPMLRRLASEDPRVGYYMLARGFGQGPAIVFGLSRSTADAMIMMDADGGHPLEVLPEMVRHYLDGARVVQCVRNTLVNRKAYRDIGAATFQLFARSVTGVNTHEQNIFFRLVSADVAREIIRQPRYWRWLRFPLPRRAGDLRKISVDSQERVLGESKYDFRRLVNLAIDGILSLIPPARFAVILVLVGIAASVLAWNGVWLLALLAVGGVAWVVNRYRQLQRGEVLQQMQVVECANVRGAE
jgi:glycosyltransferase involved in cell wall biosynthesis